MGNIYEKNGIKYMEVEYGWGMDMLAVHFPLELAIEGMKLGMKVASLGKKALIGKINTPEICWMISYCNDVIDNAKEGNDTYILEDFHADTVLEIKKVAKLISKLKIWKNKQSVQQTEWQETFLNKKKSKEPKTFGADVKS